MPRMQTRYVNGLTIRPLPDGDTETVSRLFERLGAGSRERRFCGAKPRLSERELAQLARVDGSRHVLVGYVPGDPRPAGIARLVRDGSSAEVAFEVADDYQGRGIGSVLAAELAADARAAGITTLVCGQAALNLAAVLGVAPLTGIPLPLVSYGGTSLVVMLASVGILLNIARNDGIEAATVVRDRGRGNSRSRGAVARRRAGAPRPRRERQLRRLA